MRSPTAMQRKYRRSSESDISEDVATHFKHTGVLSQTLAASSQVRWILPARIRSPRRNDVIFVGDSYIQLREILPNGHLADAIARLNIGTPILAAGVISAPSEEIPSDEAIWNQEPDDRCFMIQGVRCSDEQPPQIIVLCTVLGELVFVYARQHDDGSTSLVFAKRHILQSTMMTGKYGRHLAIVAGSKAMAITSSDGVCVIFHMQQIDELRNSIDAAYEKPFKPYLEQHFMQVDGSILKMDFLRSPNHEPDMIYLLFLVAKRGTTQLLLYRWDTTEPLFAIAAMNCSGQVLQHADAFPLLLIPSQRPLSFALVTETHVVFYDDIRSKTAQRLAVALPMPPSSTTKRPLWVQWAKPVRHDEYLEEKEDILLIREDGVTRMFSRTHEPPLDALYHLPPGELGMQISNAVCILPGPRAMGGDMLIVGGEGTDGGVFHVSARELFRMLQVIPNYSPCLAMVSLDQTSNYKGLRRKIFTISDGHIGTRLNQLRLGLEAQVGWTMAHPNISTIDDFWAFEDIINHKVNILTSHPDFSALVSFDLKSQEVEILDSDTCEGVDLQQSTLVACQQEDGCIVQVTKHAIRISHQTLRTSPLAIQKVADCVCADIDALSGIIAAACVLEEAFGLVVGMVTKASGVAEFVISPAIHAVSSRPLAMSIAQSRDYDLLLVGHIDGSACLYIIDGDKGLQEHAKIDGLLQQRSALSSVAILAHPDSFTGLLLLGARNGLLRILSFKHVQNRESHGIELIEMPDYTLGSTSVNVRLEQEFNTKTRSALIVCGEILSRVSLFDTTAEVDYKLDHVWITTRNDISYSQPQLNAARRIPRLLSEYGHDMGGLLMCATPDQILFTSFSEQEQVVPRCIRLEGHVHSIEYLPHLNKLIAIGQLHEAPKVDRPMVRVLSPDQEPMTYQAQVGQVFGSTGEKVKAVTLWKLPKGDVHYEMFVVALSDGESGRVVYVPAKRLMEAQTRDLPFKQIARYSGRDIHAICSFRSNSLVVGVGNQISLISLDVVTKKFSKPMEDFTLPSPAQFLTTRGNLIYVATSKHSMMALRAHVNHLTIEYTDRVARNAQAVITMGQERHVFLSTVSEKGTSVLGYPYGVEDGILPSFDATVPLILDNLMPVESRWCHDHHHAFQGSAVDGTIYLFKTLTNEEFKLCRFLERVLQPDIAKSSSKQISLMTKRMAGTHLGLLQQQATPFDPKNMHVNGDILLRLTESGPNKLRELMSPIIKTEDAMSIDSTTNRMVKLETLAFPVIGKHQDTVEAVVAWTRRLLRSTLF